MAKKGELLFVSATVLFTWIILCIHLGLVKIVTLAQIRNLRGSCHWEWNFDCNKSMNLEILDNLFKWFYCVFYFCRFIIMSYKTQSPFQLEPDQVMMKRSLKKGHPKWHWYKRSCHCEWNFDSYKRYGNHNLKQLIQ